MTTNKPEVFRFHCYGYNAPAYSCNKPLDNSGEYVRLIDYEALQAEYEKLRKDAERYRWLRDPCSGAERVAMYGRGDYGRGLKSYTALDASIDAAMEATK